MRKSRGTDDPLTPDKIGEWEARAFSPLRRHREQAATVVDDELPEDPQDHPAETAEALRRLP